MVLVGFRYASIGGADCFCDNSYEKYEKIADEACFTRCGSDPSQYCGSGSKLMVFDLKGKLLSNLDKDF